MKRRPNRVILDTNLMLLWLVARTDVSLLHRFKRVQAFTKRDIEILRNVIEPFHQFVTTPHILSETSNFIDQSPVGRRSYLIDEFKDFIRAGAEVYAPATALVERDEFNALGLTDTAMAELSAEAVVITVDYRLAGKIETMGGYSVNFNHYRTSLSV